MSLNLFYFSLSVIFNFSFQFIYMKFKTILNSLNINEKFTKETKKQKSFTNVKANIPQKANYNQMCDILYLPEATDKKTGEKFKLALIVVDLYTSKFDIEPLVDKQTSTVLNALLKIYKRSYVKKPFGSLQTDFGSEFKGVFHKWLHDESILHKQSVTNRHSQQSVVESLNKQIGRLIMGYLNGLEEKSGKVERNWLAILPQIRTKLNEYRSQKAKSERENFDTDAHFFNAQFESKFNIGDIVFNKLDWPEDALGNKQPTSKFRAGDYRYSKVPKKIVKVLLMNTKPYYRYVLESLPNVSYTEQELIKAGKKEKETKYVIKKILKRRINNGETQYLIHWKGYKKTEATWETEKKLIEDGAQVLINDFNEN